MLGFDSPMLAAASLAIGLAFVVVMLLWLKPNTREVPLHRRRPVSHRSRSAVAGLADAATRGVDRLLAGRRLTLTERLDVAGIATPAAQLVVIVLCACIAAVALGLLLGSLAAGFIIAFLIPLVVAAAVVVRTERRRTAFAFQLDETAQMLAGSLRSGYSFTQSMSMVGREAASPTAEEFARISNELRVGRPLSEAMGHTADRMKSEDFSWISQAVAINREVGGNLADVLDGVSHTIRERAQLRRQVAALSAEGRLSAIVLIGLPFVIIALLMIVNPGYLSSLLTHPVGWLMLGTAVILLAVGAFWLHKTVQIKF
ncbi:type II secretion system F family protein [Tessaracoccus sp. Y1736]